MRRGDGNGARLGEGLQPRQGLPRVRWQAVMAWFATGASRSSGLVPGGKAGGGGGGGGRGV